MGAVHGNTGRSWGIAHAIKSARSTQGYPRCQIAHWGNIDGKNIWKNLDTIVLYGLPYLGNVLSECAVRAFKDWHKQTQGLYAPSAYYDEAMESTVHHDDLEENKDYETGHIIVGLVQAINRIQCRNVIDKEGNCPAATVYLYLHKKDAREASIIAAIQQQMNGIEIIEDSTRLEGKAEKLPKTGQKILDFLKKQKPDEYTIDYIHKKTKISLSTLDNYIQQYNNTSSSFHRQMYAAGIIDYRTQAGRKGKRYFVRV